MIFTATTRFTGSACWAMKTDAHAAFADLLDELVAADGLAGPLGKGRIDVGVEPRGGLFFQEAAGVVMGLQ